MLLLLLLLRVCHRFSGCMHSVNFPPFSQGKTNIASVALPFVPAYGGGGDGGGGGRRGGGGGGGGGMGGNLHIEA